MAATRKIPAPRDIANVFACKLMAEIGRRNYETVRRRNRHEPNPQICHSHDFCDANMVMLTAFQDLGLCGADCPDFAADDAACELWNEAWALFTAGAP